MCLHRSRTGRRRATRRPPAGQSQAAGKRTGLSLIELLLVSTIMALMAGALAALGMAVQAGNDHSEGTGTTVQHGRVALERIERALTRATATDQFPGFFVLTEQVGGWTYPDTLVIWHPQAEAAEPGGMPRMNELVVICCDPDDPRRLLEIRNPSDTRVAPALSNTTAWQTELTNLKASSSANRVLLTDLLRTATPTDGTGTAYGRRGVIRFDVLLRPSSSQWAEYQAGDRTWENIAWPQGIYGGKTGLRQSWCRIELQLRPANLSSHGADTAIPFFGSGAVYYELERS